MIPAGALVLRSARPWTVEAEGELVMLDGQSGTYFALEPVGHRIWQLLAEPSTLETLVSRLNEEYDGSREEIARETTSFVEHLLERELVEVLCDPCA